MKINKTKYKIGQRVYGINGIDATIVGLYTGKAYNKFTFELSGTVSPYDKDDPNWRDKYVYMIEFDIPVKRYTYEEYYNFLKDKYDEEVIKDQYKHLTKTHFMSVPEFSIKPIKINK